MILDVREKKLADILVNYSIEVKKGDIIAIRSGIEAKELTLEVCRLLLKKQAFPLVHMELPGYTYLFYKNASDEMLKTFPKIAEFEAQTVAGTIGIGTESNTRELTSIDPKKISQRAKILNPISEIHMKRRNWVICEYPTAALAQDAEMSLEEYTDFVFDATIQDWAKVAKREEKLKKILDKGKTVRIRGGNTDLTFSIESREAIVCAGRRNLPDGEVFVAPVENTTEGYIHYTFPAIKYGKEVENIELWFSKGKVIKAKAGKNEDLLYTMLDTDPGARFLGEFGIGFNYNIKKFTKQILFDEKIGGTIHLALGMAYKVGGGRNDSAVHWDMIKDLRQGGEISIDGRVIQKNGKFTIDL